MIDLLDWVKITLRLRQDRANTPQLLLSLSRDTEVAPLDGVEKVIRIFTESFRLKDRTETRALYNPKTPNVT
jgi:hypothetical protein